MTESLSFDDLGKNSLFMLPHSKHAKVSIGISESFPDGEINAETFLNINAM
jgi:hypothetical protein